MAVLIGEINTMYEERAIESEFGPQKLWHKKRIKEIIQLAGNRGKILDIGCGSCIILTKLKGKKYGIDADKKTLRIVSKKHPEIHLAASGAEILPFAENSFDTVICTEVIEHLKHPEEALKEMHRVAKKGGEIIISTPNYRSVWPLIERFWSRKANVRDYSKEHISHFSKKILKKMAEESGMRELKIETKFLLYPAASVVSEKAAYAMERFDDCVCRISGGGMLLFMKARKS